MLSNRLPPRIVTSAATLVSNTLYPLFLRLRIRTVPKIIPNNFETHYSLAFLLHYAQRCYLLLFSKENSWYVVVGPIGHWPLIGRETVFWHLLEMAKTHTHIDNKRAFYITRLVKAELRWIVTGLARLAWSGLWTLRRSC